MACFAVPLVEAIVVSVVKKNIETKEKKAFVTVPQKTGIAAAEVHEQTTVPFSRKIGWLSKMLWGGSFLLAVEHIWHGEIVPWPPFLTAMNNPADIGPMFHEIATVGVTMAVLVTVIWGIMVLMFNRMEQKVKKAAVAEAAHTTEG